MSSRRRGPQELTGQSCSYPSPPSNKVWSGKGHHVFLLSKVCNAIIVLWLLLLSSFLLVVGCCCSFAFGPTSCAVISFPKLKVVFLRNTYPTDCKETLPSHLETLTNRWQLDAEFVPTRTPGLADPYIHTYIHSACFTHGSVCTRGTWY